MHEPECQLVNHVVRVVGTPLTGGIQTLSKSLSAAAEQIGDLNRAVEFERLRLALDKNVTQARLDHLQQQWAEAALRQAITRRGARVPRELLHHSDQGVQYASSSYQALLRAHGIMPSMSRKANCYDNAHMESFWATLKAELVANRTFATRAEASLAIFEYVETFYNRVRLHSALGYLSPVDFEPLNTK